MSQNDRKDTGRNKWIIGLLFFVCLFFTAYYQFNQVRIIQVNEGEVSPDYVVAQVDFSYPDRESTILVKRESLKDIKSFYVIDKAYLKSLRRSYRSSLNSSTWREKYHNITYKEMIYAGDVIYDDLKESIFTDERTKKRWVEYYKIDEHIYVVPMIQDEKFTTKLPQQVWLDIRSVLRKNIPSMDSESIQFVMNFFKNRQFELNEDIGKNQLIKTFINEQIPSVMKIVKAGDKIVGEGDTITSTQKLKLKALESAIYERYGGWKWNTLLSGFIYALVLMAVLHVALKNYFPGLSHSMKRMSLIVLIYTLGLVIVKVLEISILHIPNPYSEYLQNPLFIPFIIVMINILFEWKIALFSSFFLSIVIGSTIAFGSEEFLFLNLTAALAGIYFSQKINKRKGIFLVFARIWLFSIPILIGFALNDNALFSFQVIKNIICTGFFSLLSALLVVALLPFLESAFDVLTDITLIELTDPNNELLRRLSIEAPGTYQHSLVVGSLAESAAQKIGANGLFCRVASLYHDVGKIYHPQYFTENQMGDFNVHKLLTNVESAQVILGHVSEGVVLGKKYGLPKSFLDVIEQHHGDSLVKYFYDKEVEKEGNPDKVDMQIFRYKGPRPKTKESVVIMIADSVEAASRSLTNNSHEEIDSLIEKIVEDKIHNKQLDNSQLTFEELGIVKQEIARTLSIYYHGRPSYEKKS